MAHGASVEVAGLHNVSRAAVEPQVGVHGQAKQLELGGLLVERRTSISQILGSIPSQVAAV